MNRLFNARNLRRFTLCASLFALVGCDDDGEKKIIAPEPYAPEAYNKWLSFEPEGTTCADGTQYRYFVKFRENSENVLVLFEGGGACWSWETCSAATGTLAALGVDCVFDDNDEYCIPYDYADTYYAIPGGLPLDEYKDILSNYKWLGISNGRVSIDTVLPLANSASSGGQDVSPMKDWNLVFVPYCTADLYSGNRVAEYVNPDDPEDITVFRHVGLQNTLKVAEELNVLFPTVPEFAMNGCSAGGAGVTATFPFFRSRMKGIEKAYVFSDAGPFFPTASGNSPSAPLHAAVRQAWDVSSIFTMLAQEYPDRDIPEPEHISGIYRLLSENFPEDRFSVAHTQTDYNYSLYSYITFHPAFQHYRARNAADAKLIYEYWKQDNDALVDTLEELDNFTYYMPFWRQTNDSHCISLIGIEDLPDINEDPIVGFLGFLGNPAQRYYSGTEIEHDGKVWTYGDHVRDVMFSENPTNIFELDGEGPRKACTPDYYNEDDCKRAFGEPVDGDGDGDGDGDDEDPA